MTRTLRPGQDGKSATNRRAASRSSAGRTRSTAHHWRHPDPPNSARPLRPSGAMRQGLIRNGIRYIFDLGAARIGVRNGQLPAVRPPSRHSGRASPAARRRRYFDVLADRAIGAGFPPPAACAARPFEDREQSRWQRQAEPRRMSHSRRRRCRGRGPGRRADRRRAGVEPRERTRLAIIATCFAAARRR